MKRTSRAMINRNVVRIRTEGPKIMNSALKPAAPQLTSRASSGGMTASQSLSIQTAEESAEFHAFGPIQGGSASVKR